MGVGVGGYCRGPGEWLCFSDITRFLFLRVEPLLPAYSPHRLIVLLAVFKTGVLNESGVFACQIIFLQVYNNYKKN